MRVLLFLCFFAFGLNVSAQKVPVLSFEELEARYTQANDTLYIVNFWATWCPPCVKELPSFDSLAARHASDPWKVLLVSLDFKSKLESALLPFIQTRKVQSEVLLLNESDANRYINRVSPDWSGAIPATLIIKGDHYRFFEQEVNLSILEKACSLLAQKAK